LKGAIPCGRVCSSRNHDIEPTLTGCQYLIFRCTQGTSKLMQSPFFRSKTLS
jgi:hypothetical protein